MEEISKIQEAKNKDLGSQVRLFHCTLIVIVETGVVLLSLPNIHKKVKILLLYKLLRTPLIISFQTISSLSNLKYIIDLKDFHLLRRVYK